MKKNSQLKGMLFVLPGFAGMMIFYIIPFIESFIYCFTKGGEHRKFAGLQNFIDLMHNESYRLALKNTIVIIGGAVPLLCIGSLIVTLMIEGNLKKYKWLQAILFLPMVVPTAALMLVWQDLFSLDGILNGLLNLKVDWLKSNMAPFIMVMLIIWKNIGYNVLLMMNALLTMPKEFIDAAHLDGAGNVQMALHIKIPYMMPTLFFVIVISLFNSFKIFRDIYILQGDYPYNNLYLLQHFMNNNFNKLNYERLSTAAFILYGVIFIVIYIMCHVQQKYVQINEGR